MTVSPTCPCRPAWPDIPVRQRRHGCRFGRRLHPSDRQEPGVSIPSQEPPTTSATAPGRTMKAIVRDRYGPADVLELREVEVPRAGDGEVLVRVRAAGLDRGAWHIMAGMPYLMRIAGFGVRAPKHAGLGSDVAGVVEAVGAGVTALQAGDAVFGTCGPASRAASFA